MTNSMKIPSIMNHVSLKPILFAMLLSLGLMVSQNVRAEKADSSQPTNIEADHMDYDDLKQVNIFTGNVRLVRGTLILKGQKLVIRQDAAGYQHGTVYGHQGGVAHFRQKRDGGPNLWIEGQAERIEYDGKTEIAKFFSKAKLTRLDGVKMTDEVQGEFISYDARKEFYSVNNTPSGQSKPGAGRIKVVIQPREDKKTSAKSSKDKSK